MKKTEYLTEKGKTVVDDYGIAHSSYLKDAIITQDDAIGELQIYEEIGAGKRILCVVDISNVKAVTREARVIFGSDEMYKRCKAVAMVARSPVSRMIGNFFLGLNKVPIPLQLFTDKIKAIEWLKGYADEKSG